MPIETVIVNNEIDYRNSKHTCDVCGLDVNKRLSESGYLISLYGSTIAIILCSNHAEKVIKYINDLKVNNR